MAWDIMWADDHQPTALCPVCFEHPSPKGIPRLRSSNFFSRSKKRLLDGCDDASHDTWSVCSVSPQTSDRVISRTYETPIVQSTKSKTGKRKKFKPSSHFWTERESSTSRSPSRNTKKRTEMEAFCGHSYFHQNVFSPSPRNSLRSLMSRSQNSSPGPSSKKERLGKSKKKEKHRSRKDVFGRRRHVDVQTIPPSTRSFGTSPIVLEDSLMSLPRDSSGVTSNVSSLTAVMEEPENHSSSHKLHNPSSCTRHAIIEMKHRKTKEEEETDRIMTTLKKIFQHDKNFAFKSAEYSNGMSASQSPRKSNKMDRQCAISPSDFLEINPTLKNEKMVLTGSNHLCHINHAMKEESTSPYSSNSSSSLERGKGILNVKDTFSCGLSSYLGGNVPKGYAIGTSSSVSSAWENDTPEEQCKTANITSKLKRHYIEEINSSSLHGRDGISTCGTQNVYLSEWEFGKNFSPLRSEEIGGNRSSITATKTNREPTGLSWTVVTPVRQDAATTYHFQLERTKPKKAPARRVNKPNVWKPPQQPTGLPRYPHSPIDVKPRSVSSGTSKSPGPASRRDKKKTRKQASRRLGADDATHLGHEPHKNYPRSYNFLKPSRSVVNRHVICPEEEEDDHSSQDHAKKRTKRVKRPKRVKKPAKPKKMDILHDAGYIAVPQQEHVGSGPCGSKGGPCSDASNISSLKCMGMVDASMQCHCTDSVTGKSSCKISCPARSDCTQTLMFVSAGTQVGEMSSTGQTRPQGYQNGNTPQGGNFQSVGGQFGGIPQERNQIPRYATRLAPGIQDCRQYFEVPKVFISRGVGSSSAFLPDIGVGSGSALGGWGSAPCDAMGKRRPRCEQKLVPSPCEEDPDPPCCHHNYAPVGGRPSGATFGQSSHKTMMGGAMPPRMGRPCSTERRKCHHGVDKVVQCAFERSGNYPMESRSAGCTGGPPNYSPRRWSVAAQCGGMAGGMFVSGSNNPQLSPHQLVNAGCAPSRNTKPKCRAAARTSRCVGAAMNGPPQQNTAAEWGGGVDPNNSSQWDILAKPDERGDVPCPNVMLGCQHSHEDFAYVEAEVNVPQQYEVAPEGGSGTLILNNPSNNSSLVLRIKPCEKDCVHSQRSLPRCQAMHNDSSRCAGAGMKQIDSPHGTNICMCSNEARQQDTTQPCEKDCVHSQRSLPRCQAMHNECSRCAGAGMNQPPPIDMPHGKNTCMGSHDAPQQETCQTLLQHNNNHWVHCKRAQPRCQAMYDKSSRCPGAGMSQPPEMEMPYIHVGYMVPDDAPLMDTTEPDNMGGALCHNAIPRCPIYDDGSRYDGGGMNYPFQNDTPLGWKGSNVRDDSPPWDVITQVWPAELLPWVGWNLDKICMTGVPDLPPQPKRCIPGLKLVQLARLRDEHMRQRQRPVEELRRARKERRRSKTSESKCARDSSQPCKC